MNNLKPNNTQVPVKYAMFPIVSCIVHALLGKVECTYQTPLISPTKYAHKKHGIARQRNLCVCVRAFVHVRVCVCLCNKRRITMEWSSEACYFGRHMAY